MQTKASLHMGDLCQCRLSGMLSHNSVVALNAVTCEQAIIVSAALRKLFVNVVSA